MQTEKELFAKVMQRCMHYGTYQSKVDALQELEAGLLRCADPGSRIQWLWGATSLHCQVGNIERAITTAQEGLEIAEKMADLLFTSVFQLKLGSALVLTADWRRGVPYLNSTNNILPRLDRSACDGLTSELVQGWLAIPSILDRGGLPTAVQLLAQALDGATYTDRFSRAQALTLLANGILECRHLPGEVPDLHAAVPAAREAMRLAPTRTQTEGSAMLLFANALCLGETEDPVAALEHAQTLVQNSWALMDELGYPNAAADALTSGVTIARRLVAIRRDPAPDLCPWISDGLERMRSGPLTVGRGQASFAVAQYYLDDAVRGSFRAIAATQRNLEDAIACRPPAQYKLEGMVALAHQAAISDEDTAEQLLASANRLAQEIGRELVEYHFLLQRVLNGGAEVVRRAIDRATAILQVLSRSDRETTGLLLEVIGKGQRRLGAREPALEAFRSCLEIYQARLAEAGSPIERAERIASSEKISEEIYQILLELDRPMEAVRLVERNKLRADSLGAAIRQGVVGDEEGRRTANRLATTQARLEALPISSLAERTAEARSMRELWHQLDSIAADANEYDTDCKPSQGTMVVLRATEDGGFAHLLPSHIMHNDPGLVVALPNFTRNRLTRWVADWTEDLCQSELSRSGRPTSRILRDISDELGKAIFVPVVAEAARQGLDLKVMTIVPSGGLGVLPLSAASIETGYLGDIGHIRLSPSIEAWRSAQRRASTLAASGSQRNFGALGILGEGLEFVEKEVAAISKSLSSWSVDSKVVQNATLEDLRSSLEGAYLGHLSGHGRVVGVKEFSQSGISLGNGSYAGIRELLSLRLTSARLLTLSACQTAYIDIGRFSDEFLGPAFALVAAGACAVTAGLWNLNEVAATLLHTKLYELLANDVEPVIAHGEAILWLRTAKREDLLALAFERLGVPSIPLPTHGEQPFGSPQDWASFAYIGH